MAESYRQPSPPHGLISSPRNEVQAASWGGGSSSSSALSGSPDRVAVSRRRGPYRSSLMETRASTLTRTSTGSSTRSLLSRSSFGLGKRSSSTDGSEREQERAPKGPMGLTTLFAPAADQPAPVADVIFVHGLNGGSHRTWSKGNSPECFWPRAWLPEDDDFKDVRIHTFGYPSGVTRESIMDITEIARSLLAAVKDSPLMNKGTNQVCGDPDPSCQRSVHCRASLFL